MRSLSRSQIGAVGLGLLAISILSRVGVLWLGFSARSLQFITFCRLDAIGVGLILSYWLNGDAAVSLKLSRRELALIGALLWLVGCAAFGGWDRSIGSVIGYSMVALGSGALFLAAIGSHGRMRNPALVYLGRISYGLYIFHGTVLLLVAAAFGRNPISCIVALAATIGIAAASYRWLESPFLRLKKRFERLPSRPV